MIMRISARRIVTKHPSLGKLADKHYMTAEVTAENNIAREECVSVFSNVFNAVCRGVGTLKVGKFVNIASRLHTEMPDYLKGYIFGKHRNIEFTAFFNKLARKVALLHGNHKSCGLSSNLNSGVYNTSVVGIALCGKHK